MSRQQQGREKLEMLLQKGLESPSREWSDKDWEKLQNKLLRKKRKSK
jgi:hypothetical protein